MFITAGAIDCHVHFICPQLAHEAISSGELCNWPNIMKFLLLYAVIKEMHYLFKSMTVGILMCGCYL